MQLPEAVRVVRVDSVDSYSDFYRELREQLRAAGAQLQADAAPANAVVRVRADQTGQRVLSVSKRNTPEEYEVYYTIEYAVDVGGATAIEPQRLELTANYSYDSTAVLAKQREQSSMQKALARELAIQVLRRLSALNGKST